MLSGAEETGWEEDCPADWPAEEELLDEPEEAGEEELLEVWEELPNSPQAVREIPSSPAATGISHVLRFIEDHSLFADKLRRKSCFPPPQGGKSVQFKIVGGKCGQLRRPARHPLEWIVLVFFAFIEGRHHTAAPAEDHPLVGGRMPMHTIFTGGGHCIPKQFPLSKQIKFLLADSDCLPSL